MLSKEIELWEAEIGEDAAGHSPGAADAHCTKFSTFLDEVNWLAKSETFFGGVRGHPSCSAEAMNTGPVILSSSMLITPRG